jgi:hypothetical protein
MSALIFDTVYVVTCWVHCESTDWASPKSLKSRARLVT